jgi:hypothetical protein
MNPNPYRLPPLTPSPYSYVTAAKPKEEQVKLTARIDRAREKFNDLDNRLMVLQARRNRARATLVRRLVAKCGCNDPEAHKNLNG